MCYHGNSPDLATFTKFRLMCKTVGTSKGGSIGHKTTEEIFCFVFKNVEAFYSPDIDSFAEYRNVVVIFWYFMGNG